MSDSGGDGSLEAGEIPGLPFPSDGSFFGNFFKGELQNSNGKKMDGATKAEQSGEDLKSIAEVAALRPSEPPNSAPEAKEGDSQQKAAAEPAPKPTKPTMIVKSKRAIPNVRLRPGVQGPAAKRSKAASDKESTHSNKDEKNTKSFYLQEMERYRQQACDNTGGDRPLVK